MLPTKKKVFIILHLCFAFSYLSWLIIQPYVKNFVLQKAELSLYEMIFERKTLFSELSSQDQILLKEGYEVANLPRKCAFLKELVRIFFIETHPFALAWLFFSIVISLLFLFHIEGAKQVVWILPFILLAFGAFLYSKPYRPAPQLFPEESYVVTHYQKEEDLSLPAKEKLLNSWHRYLITEWGKDTPSKDSDLYQKQLDKALFVFNVERIKWIIEGKGDELALAGFTSAPSIVRLFFYLLWNLFFAWEMTRRSGSKASLSEISLNPV